MPVSRETACAEGEAAKTRQSLATAISSENASAAKDVTIGMRGPSGCRIAGPRAFRMIVDTKLEYLILKHRLQIRADCKFDSVEFPFFKQRRREPAQFSVVLYELAFWLRLVMVAILS